MIWLILAVVVVMVAGFAATMMIGFSKSNKEENSNYMRNTDKKWLRLSGIYVLGIVLVIVLIALLVR